METAHPNDHDASMPEMVWAAQHLPASVVLTSPPSYVKTSIMAQIREQQTLSKPAPLPQFTYLYNNDDESGWLPHEYEGVWVKNLAKDTDRNYAMMLMKMAPGAVYPSHNHTGSEQCYVLEGTANVQGHILNAGDFHHAEAGSHHGAISTETGTKLLLVVALEDYKQAYWSIAGKTLKRTLLRSFSFLRNRETHWT